MKKIINALQIVLVSSFILAPSMVQSAESPVLGTIRIAGVDNLQKALSPLADAIQPGASANLAQLPMMAAAFGIDVNGEIIVAVMEPMSGAPVAILVPTSNPDALLQNPMLGFAPSGQEGIYTFSPQGAGMSMVAAIEGSQVMIAPSEAGLAKVRTLVKANAFAAPAGERGQIEVDLAMDRLMTSYKPFIDMGLQMMRAQLQQAPSAGGMDAETTMKMMEAYVAFFSDLKQVDASVSFTAKGVRAASTVQAKPGTPVATFLTFKPSGASIPTAGLPSGAGVIGNMTMELTPEYVDAYMAVVTEMVNTIGSSQVDESQLAELKATTAETLKAIDGTGSFCAFVPNDSNFVTAVYGIKDSAKAVALLEKLPKQMDAWGSFDVNSGLKTKTEVIKKEEKGGITYLDTKTTYEATNEAGEEALKLMNASGFDVSDMLTSSYAIADKRMVFAMGPDSRSMVEKVATSKAPADVVSPSQFAFPKNPNFFIAWSAPRIIHWVSSIGGLPDEVAGMVSADAPFSSGMSMYSSGEGRFTSHLHFGVEDIKALIMVGERIP